MKLFLLLALLNITTLAYGLQRNPGDLILVLNQPQYASGDTVFFNVISFEEKFKSTQIINIALYRNEDRILFQRNVISNDISSGYIGLPLSMEPGNYSLLIELNGSYYQSKFPICPQTVSHNYDTAMTNNLLTSNFGDQPYMTDEDIQVSLNLRQHELASSKRLIVSVIRDTLFNALNIITCKRIHALEKNEGANLPELFSGKVISENGKKIPDSTRITFHLKEADFIYPVYTKNNGDFSYPLFKNFESDEVYYSITFHEKEELSAYIKLNDVFEKPIYSLPDSVGHSNNIYCDYSKKKLAIVNSYSFFSKEEESNHAPKQREYYAADQEVLLDKYEKFPSMAEVAINILPAVKYRKSTKRESIRVFLKESAQSASHDPLYIIDGYFTNDTDVFLGLDPQKIKTIKVLRSRERLIRFGDLGKNGIVVVESKYPEGLRIPQSIKTLQITGINKEAIFTNTLQKFNNNLLPDVRSCLYWNSDLTVNKDGNASFTFYTGGISGTLKLLVTVVSSDEIKILKQKGVVKYKTD